MAGFAKISVVQNIGGIAVLNVFWYRSDTWLPLVGNPFAAMQDALNAFDDNIMATWRAATQDAVVIQRLEGVGYTDGMVEVEGSNATHTIQLSGLLGDSVFDSFGLTANISWICGAQHQITGLGSSQRNRGTTSFGPVASDKVSSDGHFTGTYVSLLINNLANSLRSSLIDAGDFATLVPIRMHKAVSLGVTTGTTYSDILGYKLPTKVTFRRSRLPEA